MQDWSLVLIIIFLIGLNLAQFIYWARIQSQMIDKLLSRNYHDYVTAKNYPKSLEIAKVKNEKIEEELELQNQSVLSELNSIFTGPKI